MSWLLHTLSLASWQNGRPALNSWGLHCGMSSLWFEARVLTCWASQLPGPYSKQAVPADPTHWPWSTRPSDCSSQAQIPSIEISASCLPEAPEGTALCTACMTTVCAWSVPPVCGLAGPTNTSESQPVNGGGNPTREKQFVTPCQTLPTVTVDLVLAGCPSYLCGSPQPAPLSQSPPTPRLQTQLCLTFPSVGGTVLSSLAMW